MLGAVVAVIKIAALMMAINMNNDECRASVHGCNVRVVCLCVLVQYLLCNVITRYVSEKLMHNSVVCILFPMHFNFLTCDCYVRYLASDTGSRFLFVFKYLS